METDKRQIARGEARAHLAFIEVPVVQHARRNDGGVAVVTGVAVVLAGELAQTGSSQRRPDLLGAALTCNSM